MNAQEAVEGGNIGRRWTEGGGQVGQGEGKGCVRDGGHRQQATPGRGSIVPGAHCTHSVT